MYSPYSASSPELIDIIKPPVIYCPLTPPDEKVTYQMEIEIDNEAVIVEVKARREKERVVPEPEVEEEMSIEDEPKPHAVPEELAKPAADAHNNGDSDADSWPSASFEDRFDVEIEQLAQVLEEKLYKKRFD